MFKEKEKRQHLEGAVQGRCAVTGGLMRDKFELQARQTLQLSFVESMGDSYKNFNSVEEEKLEQELEAVYQ